MLSYFNGVIIMHKDGKYIGYIYKILNTINDKLYIGQTTSSIEKRFNDHLSAARTMKSSSMIIIHAINKYGEESFSISEVEKVICDSQEELQNLLNTKEIYYIAYYNSLRPNGYNITKGGNYTSPTTMSKVDQYDYQGNLIFTYDSLEDAKNTISPTAISSTNIGAACKGDSMSAYGYIWRYHGEPFDKYSIIPKKNCKKINQYSKNNVFIKTYSSIKEASKETGACETTIIPCCRYKRNYSGGFKWYYADDINQPDKTRIIAA
jgi:group I intron endonuclease|nr:MAG TPA: intron associated endonuclease [Caudoviricetes sp.]